MSNQPTLSKPAPIEWDFTLTLQGQTSRYGHAGNFTYKQYLPGGIVDETNHPPKRIDKRQYLLADKQRMSVRFGPFA